MLFQKGHNITGINAPKDNGDGTYTIKKVTAVYRYGKLLWQAILSCFGKGYWINNEAWSNDDAWTNNAK